MTDKKLFFNLGGKNFSIEDLEHPINNEFISLHQSIFGLPAVNINEFKNKSFDFFDKVKNKDKWELQDKYFNNFTIIWRMLLNQRKFIEAEEIWKLSLDIASEWEKKKQERIHKGTPYYFWAVTCFLNDDIDKGFWLMNQAYLEDVSTHKIEEPNTPAKYFLYFDTLPKEQFFKSKLDEIKEFLLKYFIETYKLSRTRSFSYNGFENKFLKEKNIHREIKFHFNLSIFRLEKILNKFPKISNKNTISSLFYLEIIFDLCRVLEFLIKNPNRDNFSEDIKDLAKKYNNTTQIVNVNSPDFHTNNFMKTLQDILNSNYLIDGSIPDNLESDILISYGFRNFGAHRIEEHSLIVNNFDKIIRSIMNTIFLSIELYLR